MNNDLASSEASASYAYEPNRNLKTQVLNQWGTNVVSQFDDVNDPIGRRTQRIDTLSVTNDFGYNARSELASALMGTNTYGYVYDPIGNRLTATNHAEVWHYAANELRVGGERATVVARDCGYRHVSGVSQL